MITISKPFYFIRHGQTDWNLNNILMGQTDIPLNQTGIWQAKQLQQKLKNLNFDTIFSSPLLRASETATIINETSKLPVILKDGLMERCRGIYEGKVKNNQILQTLNKDNQIKEETLTMFKQRIITTLNDILEQTEVIPLIVSHGGVFKILKEELNIDYPEAMNCGVYLFKPTDNIIVWQIEEIQ